MKPAEVAVPEEIPVEVVAVVAEGAEGNVEPFPVRGRRPAAVGVGLVVALVRHLLGGDLAPTCPACAAVEAVYFKAVVVGRRFGPRLKLRLRFGSLARRRDPVGLGGGEDEYLVVPDDRRRAAGTCKRHLPLQVLVRVPGNGRVAVRGGAV